MIWIGLLLQVSASITAGEKVFAQSCAVGYCHGAAGAASRGPRLRGRTFDKDYLYRTITEGIPKSAMPSWKDRLNADQIRVVVDYIQSLASATGEPVNVTASAAPAAPEAFDGPPAAARGRELFFATNGCGSCHALGGRGTAIGPDVSQAPKEQLTPAIQSPRARLVQTIRLKDGDTFPAIIGPEDGAFVQVFDLTSLPPVRRNLEKSEIVSKTPAPTWSHQAQTTGLTPEQLADIVAYIRR
jgi:putative heme-binding domain-containing protein